MSRLPARIALYLIEQLTAPPNTRPLIRRLHVIDHIIPLKRGGADAPSNMQWQTKEAAKAKDKWE